MYYLDSRQRINATHSISTHVLQDIRDEQRQKMLQYIAYDLARALRSEAERVTQALKWERFLFIEVSPYEWPDMSTRMVEAMIYAVNPAFEVRAHGHVFECLPDWDVRKMEGAPLAGYDRRPTRPVATLDGRRGRAIAESGVILFWPEKALASAT